MRTPEINHIDGPAAFTKAFGVSRETIARLETYAALLKRWQKTINLVAPSTLDEIWHRHFADSAQLWPLRPEGAKAWLDLGSGAGFPGIVLAILAAEAVGTRHTLVESDSRKAAFLREVARETGVAVDILCTRIESPETHSKVSGVDCVTARALAPLPRLLALAEGCFSSSTTGLFLKGRGVQAECDAASAAWDFESEMVPSVTEAGSAIVVVRRLRRKVL
jgi:16S rRNA (guanine527-N7)-methyltransferase